MKWKIEGNLNRIDYFYETNFNLLFLLQYEKKRIFNLPIDRFYIKKNCVASNTWGFNKFPDFFVQAVKIVVDSWKFSMFLLYILWDGWLIYMISCSNEQLQQQLEYDLLQLVNFKNSI